MPQLASGATTSKYQLSFHSSSSPGTCRYSSDESTAAMTPQTASSGKPDANVRFGGITRLSSSPKHSRLRAYVVALAALLVALAVANSTGSKTIPVAATSPRGTTAEAEGSEATSSGV